MKNDKTKKNIYQTTLYEIGKDAHLTSNKPSLNTVKEVKAKHLKAVPVCYFDAYAKLIKENRTSLDFTSYILEALREKLGKDGVL